MKVLAKVANPSDQISLNLSNSGLYQMSMEEAENLSNLFSVNLSKNPFEKIRGLSNIRQLNLSQCFLLTEILELQGIHSLVLRNNKNTTEIPFIESLEELDITGSSKIHKFDHLINLKKLSLEIGFVDALDQIKSLKYLRELTIRRHTLDEAFIGHDGYDLNLPNLLKLSLEGFGGFPMRIISLSSLQEYRNSANYEPDQTETNGPVLYQEILKNLRRLSISLLYPSSYLTENQFQFIENCKHLQFLEIRTAEPLPMDLKYFAHIPNLSITGGVINSLEPLQNCRRLSLKQTAIPSLEHLGKIKELKLRGYDTITTTNGLGMGNFCVDLDCSRLIDVKALASVRMVVLDECVELTDISPLKNVEFLSLAYCTKVQNFHHLGNQKYLDVSGCNQLQNHDLKYFQNIFDLNISSCYHITDLSPLTGINRLTAQHCLGLKQVSLHQKYLFKIDFTNCHALELVNIYGTIFAFSVGKINTVVNIYGKVEYFADFSSELLPDFAMDD
jgi:hypothetical protein